MLDVYGLVVPPELVPAAPEVLVACDAAEPARLGALADRLGTARHSIMIDHHATNPGFGQLQLLDPGAEATVVVVRRLLAAMDVPLDADVARCIYAGLVTDTSSFITAGESAHRLAAELVAAGVDAEPLVRSLMDTHPYAWLAALGRALERRGAGAGRRRRARAWCTPRCRSRDVDRFRTEDVDSVVDMVRTTAEAEVAAVFKQVGRDAVDHLAALRRPDRRGRGGRPARRRRASAARPASPGTAPRTRCWRRCAPRWRRSRPRRRRARRRLTGCRRPGAVRAPIAGGHAQRTADGGDQMTPNPGRPDRVRPTSARRAFLAAALRRPGTVGAVVPSSARLAEVLAAVVPTGGLPGGGRARARAPARSAR